MTSPYFLEFDFYIRNTPNLVSGMGELRVAAKLKPRTCLVSTGSMMPSSQSLKQRKHLIDLSKKSSY